jgi:hypothetical protein
MLLENWMLLENLWNSTKLHKNRSLVLPRSNPSLTGISPLMSYVGTSTALT